MEQEISIFWFRRDLRLHDNAGLYHALRSGYPVLPIFIFDANILNDLTDKQDRRVAIIFDTLTGLHEELKKYGSTLHVLHGAPEACFKELVETYDIKAVYTNKDYEPYATARDKKVADYLSQCHIHLHLYKDQVIFERGEVLKDDNSPYTIYTPYSRRWKERLNDFYLKPYPVEKYFSNFYLLHLQPFPSLESIGFKKVFYEINPPVLKYEVAKHYDKTRNIPAIIGTTLLSVHLRFGTVSIRQIVNEARQVNIKLLNELIWREFYQQILWHFPYVVNHCFRKEYDDIQWRNNNEEFEKWRIGNTGYPIVDAGMRELNETGYMHNRVRMITASFLTKDLLIDWRWGEAYFAEKLLDYDLAANNGNWQWVAGTGCDAAPYFRIFNPALQTEKFDHEHKYIRRWVPEYDSLSYPAPIVEHDAARKRCLAVYGNAIKK